VGRSAFVTVGTAHVPQRRVEGVDGPRLGRCVWLPRVVALT
jgi:hypothetical protein